ncbi:Glyoxalase-like domain protein [Pseudoruegeria aquimaris]|uniref:Glyoxalase-like domain protein n=1 Tax=Pseudoruegeria aquimaris TaxID=393663 RepID=A0A1Y5SEY1_9RHOB|nr:VOC family protein [Pseudoruegeria aquimaris]SLN39244.1 Glyoxalase-like domain protein [Pseudoruegeria aquimaris]
MPTVPENALVWCEIPVSNLADAMVFYATVLDWELTLDETGPNPVAFFPMTESSVAGHLYPGKPGKGAGPTVHLAVPDTAEAAAARAEAAGGTRVMGPITIPAGQFIYILDPDGNSVGLFEAA